MKRILIIGSGGSGKSTFARRLGEKTGLEVIHLDKLYWQPGWVEPPKPEWQKTIAEISKGDLWIMDGNYSGTLEPHLAASDTVIFLDLPRIICVWRVIKRFWLYRRETRPDMAAGCREKLDWAFIAWVWNYPQRTKPKIEKLLNQAAATKTIVRLKSTSEVEDFLINLQPKS